MGNTLNIFEIAGYRVRDLGAIAAALSQKFQLRCQGIYRPTNFTLYIARLDDNRLSVVTDVDQATYRQACAPANVLWYY